MWSEESTKLTILMSAHIFSTQQDSQRLQSRGNESGDESPHSKTLHAVSERAAQTIKIAERNNWLLDIGLNHLTLGRAALYESLLSDSPISNLKSEIEQSVSGLRRAGQQQYLPLGLLTRAWFRFLSGERTGPDSAQSDLDEAWEIAVRGSMKLFLADIHLHRARLFFREPTYPWQSPAADLAAAKQLIHDCGYHRRDEELADSNAVIAHP